MVTKSAKQFFQNPTKGVKKSLLFPGKENIRGLFAHNSVDTLSRAPNNNIFNIEKEYGKYGSQHFTRKQTARQFSSVFGRKKKPY